MSREPELVSPFRLTYTYQRSLGPVLGRFLSSLKHGVIEGIRTATGEVIVPPKAYDPRTGAETTGEFVEVGPFGTVTTWTWVDEPGPGDPYDTPFAWALVLLDRADTPMLHAVRAHPKAMRTGMRVRATFAAERTGTIHDLAGFEPMVHQTQTPTDVTYQVHAGATTGSFVTHILDKQLVGRRCPACEKVFLPPRGSCPTCAVPTRDEVPLGQVGTVLTFSVIRIPFEGQLLEPPYACAHVLIDGADTPLLHIIGECDVDEVRMGMRVEAVWMDEPEPTLGSIRYFRPADQPDADYDSFKEHLG